MPHDCGHFVSTCAELDSPTLPAILHGPKNCVSVGYSLFWTCDALVRYYSICRLHSLDIDVNALQ